MFAAPLSGTKPAGGVTARGPLPAGNLMKTSPETTFTTTDLPGTGGLEPSRLSSSSRMPSWSRSPGCTMVKVTGGLTPVPPLAPLCEAWAV